MKRLIEEMMSHGYSYTSSESREKKCRSFPVHSEVRER